MDIFIIFAAKIVEKLKNETNICLRNLQTASNGRLKS